MHELSQDQRNQRKGGRKLHQFETPERREEYLRNSVQQFVKRLSERGFTPYEIDVMLNDYLV